MNLTRCFYLSLFLVSFQVLANGGPVNWTSITAVGDIKPLQRTDISLEQEDLNIKLSLKNYAIQAVYILEADSISTVNFGIPIDRFFSEEEDVLDEESMQFYKKSDYNENLVRKYELVNKNIKLELNNKKVKCISPKSVKEFDALNERLSAESLSWSGFSKYSCVASLKFKKGTNTLKMNYVASYDFMDSSTSKTVMTDFSDREVYYPLSPAGYWKGNVGLFNLKIDLGPYDGFESVGLSPVKLSKVGKVLQGSQKNLDLKKHVKISLSLKPTLLSAKEMMGFNASKNDYFIGGNYKIKSSSSLKGNYGTKNLRDGNIKTAWCEGEKGSGKGSWLEFHFSKESRAEYSCKNFHGMVLTQGYSKDQVSFNNNARIKKASLSVCGSDEVIYQFQFKDFKRHDLAVQYTGHIKYRGEDSAYSKFKNFVYEGEPACLKLTIDEVYEGERFEDACISEIALLYNCG